ncbi:hypothetical protein [Demetria terragena]|uniref:membrane protein YczE n=1 Tax=Demetria terragena TaxID=63959 RepID=UPI000363B188
MVGLTLYGVSVALLVRAGLGTMPWSVLEVGIAERLDRDLGVVIVAVSFIVLLLWIPLRQRVGIGTLANSLWVGPAAGVTLAKVPTMHDLVPQVGLLLLGIVLNGLATAMYIGTRLGPGPRDGLMTGLHARTGRSLRLIRTGIEVTVVAVGILLGGVAGIGTVLYALAIGPIVQLFLPRFTVAETAGSSRDSIRRSNPSEESGLPAGQNRSSTVPG